MLTDFYRNQCFIALISRRSDSWAPSVIDQPYCTKSRSKRIAFHKFNPDYIPTKHRIVITNRSQSKWAKVSNGILRVTANLKDVEQFIRKTYLKIIVYIVEWHQMLFIKQIELSLLTTILISSARGVSIRAPFLPHGSQNSMGFNIGASVSMEGILLNHFLQ